MAASYIMKMLARPLVALYWPFGGNGPYGQRRRVYRGGISLQSLSRAGASPVKLPWACSFAIRRSLHSPSTHSHHQIATIVGRRFSSSHPTLRSNMPQRVTSTALTMPLAGRNMLATAGHSARKSHRSLKFLRIAHEVEECECGRRETFFRCSAL